MRLTIVSNKFAVCRLDSQSNFPDWAVNNIFYSVTKSSEELSVVTLQNQVPLGIKSENEWRIIKVPGPLDFSLTGVLSAMADPLALAEISIFALPAFDTVYILVRHDEIDQAKSVLEDNNFVFI